MQALALKKRKEIQLFWQKSYIMMLFKSYSFLYLKKEKKDYKSGI